MKTFFSSAGASPAIAILAVCGCDSGSHVPDRIDTRAAIARVQLEMSMQMLRMEVSRDEVEDVGGDAVQKCDPKLSVPIYKDVRRELEDVIKRGGNEDAMRALGAIQGAWQRLEMRHEMVWRMASKGPNTDPKDWCIRASAVAGSRVEIERNWFIVVTGSDADLNPHL